MPQIWKDTAVPKAAHTVESVVVSEVTIKVVMDLFIQVAEVNLVLDPFRMQNLKPMLVKYNNKIT